jgi:ATP-binding cassette subfamily B protein
MADDERPGGDAGDAALRSAADRLLLRMAWRGGHWAILLALTSVAGAVADTLLPWIAGHTVDVVLRAPAVPAGPAGPASPVGRWLAGCIALIFVIVACGALSQLAANMSTAAATAWLRHRLAGHVFACGLRLPARFPVGDLVGRMVGGTAEAGYAPASSVLAVAAVIPPAGSVIALALIDPWLAVAFAGGLPALAVVIRSFTRDSADITVRYQQAQGAIAARLLDALAGARTIAAAGTCDQEAARVLVPLAEVRLHGRASWRIQARIAAQGSLIVPLLQVVVLGVAGVARNCGVPSSTRSTGQRCSAARHARRLRSGSPVLPPRASCPPHGRLPPTSSCGACLRAWTRRWTRPRCPAGRSSESGSPARSRTQTRHVC